jgi:hypothetical protein
MKIFSSFPKTISIVTLLLVPLSRIPVFADALKGTGNVLAQEITKVELSQQRAKAFANAMKDLPADQQQKFWEEYKSYAAEKAVFDETRFKLMDEYMTNYLLLKPSQARDLMDRWIRLQQDELKSRIKMFKRLSKKVSPLVGTRFYQMDDYVNSALHVQYMQRYPIFGEKPQ